MTTNQNHHTLFTSWSYPISSLFKPLLIPQPSLFSVFCLRRSLLRLLSFRCCDLKHNFLVRTLMVLFSVLLLLYLEAEMKICCCLFVVIIVASQALSWAVAYSCCFTFSKLRWDYIFSLPPFPLLFVSFCKEKILVCLCILHPFKKKKLTAISKAQIELGALILSGSVSNFSDGSWPKLMWIELFHH